MRELLHRLTHPAPPPPELRTETGRIESMIEAARREHASAIEHANSAFQDTLRITQQFLERERRR